MCIDEANCLQNDLLQKNKQLQIIETILCKSRQQVTTAVNAWSQATATKHHRQRYQWLKIKCWGASTGNSNCHNMTFSTHLKWLQSQG